MIYEYDIFIEEKEERRERRKGEKKKKKKSKKEILTKWIKNSHLIMGNSLKRSCDSSEVRQFIKCS